MGPEEAAAAGAKALLIGVAPVGGLLPGHWIASLTEALRSGLDIVSGLHTRLNAIAELATLAASLGRKLHDVRHSEISFPVATGRKRRGKRVLTVGTDCAIGKKYAALALTNALKARGLAADFRATGRFRALAPDLRATAGDEAARQVERPLELHDYDAALLIDVENRPGVLAQVAAAVAKSLSNIERVEYLERDINVAVLRFSIQVRDRNHLAEVMRRLRRLNVVHGVRRQ